MPLRAAIAIAAAAALAAAAPAGATPGSPPSALVTVGDSFISGEAGRWAGNSRTSAGSRDGTDRAARCRSGECSYEPARVYGATAESGCHRSDTAPVVSAAIPVEAKVNLACSGARTENVWRAARGGQPHRGERPQADRLAVVAARRDVRMIVLTVGANDLGFGHLVAGCAFAWTTGRGHCHPRAQRRLEEAMPAARAGIVKAIREIRRVMAAAGYARAAYRLVLAGYASPVARGARFRYPETGWSRLDTGGCPFWDEDADWARRTAIPYIARNMRAVAAELRAEFLDLRSILAGHEVCHRDSSLVSPSTPKSQAGSEWVRWLEPGCCQGEAQESLHPNAYGQRAIGRCLALLYAQPRGDWRCRRSGATRASAYLTAIR